LGLAGSGEGEKDGGGPVESVAGHVQNSASVFVSTAPTTKTTAIPAGLEVLDEHSPERLTRPLGAGRLHSRSWLIHRALAVADTVALLVAFLVALVIFHGEAGEVELVGELVLFVAVIPLWILLAKLHGLYDHDDERTDYSTVDDITGAFSVVTIGTWLFFLIGHATDLVNPSLQRIVAFWLLAIALVPLSRGITRSVCRRSEAYVQNTVVVGTGAVARHVARKILSHPESGLKLIGFVDSSPAANGGEIGGLSVLGSPTELRQLVHELGVERIVVSFTDDGPERTLSLVRGLRDLDVQIDIVPRLYEAVGINSTVHMIGGMPLVGLPPVGLSPSSRFLKRALDIVGATVGLIILAPLFAAIAIAIKIDSPGPVFFRQLRRGEREKTFRIFKFRTMVADAEVRKQELAHLNMHADEDPRMFKIPNDPRLTHVGNFLRRTSLDELPQLINVLRGEMSLVGPRPLILEEDDYVHDWARKRLELRPGITGLWQVLGRSDIPFGEMTQLDYLYVTSWSLSEDLRLIFRTLPSLWRDRKAF
jgi:exopolysaccharide biosynthesis polyprenyl glycosylphosphotransferase